MTIINHKFSIINTVEPLYNKHHWDQQTIPFNGSVLYMGSTVVINTVEPLYNEHHWDQQTFPFNGGVL